MKHSFIDTYAYLNSPIHRIPVKLKIVSALCMILAITLFLYSLPIILLSFLIVSFIIYISKIPLQHILKRILEVSPFIILFSSLSLFKQYGFFSFAIYALKALLAVTIVILLTSTTRFADFLKGLDGFGMPHLIILLLSFMYRYVFLLEDQILRVRRAYELRKFYQRSHVATFKALGNIIGVIFIRTYERAERVYLAMCARGFDGEKNH